MLSFIQTGPEELTSLPGRRKVARVLLADSDLPSRLALQSLLTTAGYGVDSVATSGEAMSRLDRQSYQLVMADLKRESTVASSHLLAYARQKDYLPATALLCSDLSELEASPAEQSAPDSVVRMSDENVSYLLFKVAELISERADRRIRRNLGRVS